MATITVTDKWRISSHPYGWTVERQTVNKNQIVWNGYRYYTSFPAAVDGLAEILLRDSPATDITQLKQDALIIADLIEGVDEAIEDGEEVEWQP